MAYSIDLRKRVIDAVDAGVSYTQAAARFQVGRTTVYHWVQRSRQQQGLRPRTSPGRPRTIDEAAQGALLAQLQAHPDATLQAHIDLWVAAHPDQSLSVNTIAQAIGRLGWTRKKVVARRRTEPGPARGLSRAHRPASRNRR